MNNFEKNITFVIVSFKSGHIIEKCIKSINSSIKIIVVENSDNIEVKNCLENKIPFGTGKDETRSIAISDLNKDGWSDLILANINEPNSICFGDASMSFKNIIKLDNVKDASFSIDVADYDQDGDVDILVGNSGEPNRIYQNLGDGKSYKMMLLSSQDFDTYDIRFGDLDKDGFKDVVEENSKEVNVYYINRKKIRQ